MVDVGLMIAWTGASATCAEFIGPLTYYIMPVEVERNMVEKVHIIEFYNLKKVIGWRQKTLETYKLIDIGTILFIYTIKQE